MKKAKSISHRRVFGLRRLCQRRLVAAALLMASAIPAWAATITFVGLAPNPAERSFWDVAANWSPSMLPGSADDALLGAFSVNHRIGTTVVNSLVSGAGGLLRLTGGELGYASGSSAVNFEQVGGQLSGAALFRVTGSAALDSGTHRGTGVTELGGAGGTHRVGSMTFTEGRTLRNLGTLTHTSGNLILWAASDSTSRFVNDGSFNISVGTLQSLRSGTGVVVADMVTNNGTITKTGNLGYNLDTLDQRGTLNIAAGQVNLFQVGRFAGDSVSGGAGVFSLTGTGSVLDVASGADTSTLNLRIGAQGAKLSYAGDMSVQSLAHADGILEGAGKFTVLNSANMRFGFHRGPGITEVGAGAGPYTIAAMTFESGRTLRNVGTLTQTDRDLILKAESDSISRFVNDGSFNISVGTLQSLRSGTGVVVADMVTNNGTISKTGSNTYIMDSLDQRGTLSVQAGTLLLNGPSRLAAGETRIAPAAILTLRGNGAMFEGGLLSVDGTLTADVNNARLLQTGGVLQGDGTLRDAAYFGPSDFALLSTGGRLTAGSQDSVGQLTIDAGISLSGAAVLEVDILSLASFDTFAVSRFSLLGGSVQVDALDPNLALNVNDRFRVATFGSGYDGTFAGVSAPSPFNGFFAEFRVDYNVDSVDLVVVSLTPVPEPSTWALMAMGVAGLLGWRRRSENRPAGPAFRH
jgi:hypothetical protein